MADDQQRYLNVNSTSYSGHTSNALANLRITPGICVALIIMLMTMKTAHHPHGTGQRINGRKTIRATVPP